MEGNETNLKTIEPDASCLPSSSVGCKVNCTDSESLRSILGVTLDHVSELSNLCSSSNRSEFYSRFSDTFKNALQENIDLNGLPLRLDKSSKLSVEEKEDHNQLVDDAVFSNLSKAVSDVAHKRKYVPEQCCRILQMQIKHDLQNLKKAKVVNSSASSLSSVSSVTSPSKNRSLAVNMKFKKFCKELSSVQENVHQNLQKKNKLAMEISLASDIKKQRPCLRSNTVGSLQELKRRERKIHSENS